MQVVNELRITQVCRLLAETNRTVSEIAYGCGFESLPNFHCQFRRIMKTSPGKYRHKLANITFGNRGAAPG
jgi:AraC-like DNA-binding protein